MFRLLILCTLLHSALFMSIERSYDRQYEKDVLKMPHYYHKYLQQPSLQNHNSYLDNEKSHDYDDPALSKDTRRTRILKWFKKILITTAEPRSFSFEDMTRDNTEESNMTAILVKLVNALDGLNNNLKCNNRNDYVTVRFPTRQKRDTNNVTNNTHEDTDHINNENVTSKSSLKLAERSDSSYGSDDSSNNNERAISDEIAELLADSNASSSKDLGFSNKRRFIFTPKPLPRLKQQLLTYIEDMFIDIERKIRPLTRVKLALSDDNSYRIGYVIANIDSLQIQLRKLKEEMDEKKAFWNADKVNELFDKLRIGNNVVSNLLDVLMSHLPGSTVLA